MIKQKKEMKKTALWVFAAIFTICSTSVMTSCIKGIKTTGKVIIEKGAKVTQ